MNEGKNSVDTEESKKQFVLSRVRGRIVVYAIALIVLLIVARQMQ